MIHVERFLFHGFARFVLAGKCWWGNVGWEMLARLGVECSTEVIANVCSNTRSVRCAHTAHDCRWRDNQTRAWSEEGRSSRARGE